MSCEAFDTRIHAYVDGELDVSDTLAVEAHVAACPACRAGLEREQRLRALLRRQPREAAPAELRAAVVTAVRGAVRRRARRPWLGAAAAAATAAAAVLAVTWLGPARETAAVVGQLVDTHIAYAQLDRPAEFASSRPAEVGAWFLERAALRVTVPDYSMAGIRLVGGRVADVGARRAAYLIYEKGRTLMSVFLAEADGARLDGTPERFRGYTYLRRELKGYHTVAWAEGGVVFALVSMLDYRDLLECADKLRLERGRAVRL